jgi:hypothetical protein
MNPARPPAVVFFIRTVKNNLIVPLVPRFPSNLGLHPSGEVRPSPIPGAHSGTPDERKAGTDPLHRRENTQTLLSGHKSPSPSPRCSIAAGTTPRQSTGRLPELRRSSSHQPIFRHPACRLAIFCRRATPPVASRRHVRKVFVHLPGQTWTRTTRRSRC